MLYDIEPDWSFLEGEHVICSVDRFIFTVMIVNTEPGDDAPLDKILRVYQFSIYCGEQFCPDYERLRTLDPTGIAAAVRR